MSALIDGTPQRIVVFRALMLGDLLCAVPALRALRAAYPGAEITLVGLPWARLLAQRFPYVDDFIEFPGYPGLPEATCDARALPDFLAQVQARRFDLALQLHGNGTIVNPLVAAFGAQQSAGFAAPGAWVPEEHAALYRRWPEHGHEIERLLSLIDHLGLARQGTHLEFPITDADRDALRAEWPEMTARRPYVCMHAGAPMPSRRWHPQRFAEVADAMIERAHTVVLTGSRLDEGLVNDVMACMRHTPVNLCGRTTLWTLGALIEGAESVICNDTGVPHIAAALGRPSVVISCGSDPQRWAPLDGAQHRVLAHPMPCRPCRHADCPTGHECAFGVEAEHVVRIVPTTATARAPSQRGLNV
jgi:ADP-heptose:LPS heptosyltransferase